MIALSLLLTLTFVSCFSKITINYEGQSEDFDSFDISVDDLCDIFSIGHSKCNNQCWLECLVKDGHDIFADSNGDYDPNDFIDDDVYELHCERSNDVCECDFEAAEVPLTLVNGWEVLNQNSVFAVRQGNMVQLWGVAVHANAKKEGVAAIIPNGFRPYKTFTHFVNNMGSQSEIRISIDTNGEIEVTGRATNSPAYVWFHSILYLVQQ